MDFEQNYRQCLEKLIWATDQLKVEVPPPQLSKIAKIIVKTMTGPWRYFHSTEHIFAVGGSTDAMEVLAALFHDIVYVQIDGSVNFNLSYYLSPFIEEDRGQLFIRDQSELPDDLNFEIVSAMFDFVPGQVLYPLTGQNEFLSAVVAAKVLGPFLSPSLILQIAACIEATIPFRAKSESGLSPSELLYQRMKLTSIQFDLPLTDGEIVETVKRAVRVSNRDVYSFSHPSSAVFLANTWSLLPETNHNLQKAGSYTVRDYRIAIQKMAGFMSFLKPELVFRQFQGEPDDETYQKMVEQASKNIEVARLYLDSKLVANAIIEGLSLRLGSDVSLSIMMGELPDSGVSVGRMGDSFPCMINPHQPRNYLEKEVLSLLEVGRSNDISYDLKTSPLTAFIVKFIGFQEIRQLRERSQAFFQGSISPEDFLGICNTDLIRIIANEVKILLENRQYALCHPWDKLPINLA
ncbi:MAG TPA: hypothetical protein DEG17_17765 [Cyanobacteria bacterium UBA11149]|nr:hypothetical protein [Cyanobacteria bacterium UBA11367]HBE59567.1 hypothetical protein [Cyanobacteria bacterium UBA11366]HBK62610.1 hypothetical protein [Cyanobacteria bacterium UBA11166]HBR73138.1 hypothetical protein [Cyanobacteria bacterium UBA11159]HBS71078.1 hypothetical protein [Cyanobacteria bacterium UBA11153]HBW90669.1 hypothetical protein [Cyanobacteria bacterium UBA11149]HCA95943.1 hypothetical protein [Cyanobacteria bacterium UBA9226]